MAPAVAAGPEHEGRTAPSPIALPADRHLERIVDGVERHSRWVLPALLALSAALLLYMGRGLSFFYDDWDFVTHDYGGGLHSLLQAHVGNISVFPIALYKVLFHLVGLNHYAVFRLVVIVLHLACGGMIFLLASRRISTLPALLAAGLILFMGAAWEDLLWAFQVGYLLSVAGGLACWVLLERRDRLGDVLAMFCLLVSVGSSSLGIAVMVGVFVELAWERRWRSLWIVLIPAFLYLLWYSGYGESQLTENGVINAPGFAEDLAAAAFGGLVGRALEWGRPLALLGALTVVVRLVRPIAVSARLTGLLATAVALWAVTALARSTVSQPETSRYIYLGAVVIVLIGVELLREVAITARASAVAAMLVAVCAVTGLTVLHAGAMGLRSTSSAVTARAGCARIGCCVRSARVPTRPAAGPSDHGWTVSAYRARDRLLTRGHSSGDHRLQHCCPCRGRRKPGQARGNCAGSRGPECACEQRGAAAGKCGRAAACSDQAVLVH